MVKSLKTLVSAKARLELAGALSVVTNTGFVQRTSLFKGYQSGMPGRGGRLSASVGIAVKLIFQLKGLILAQNERWRRGLGMQVVRETPSGVDSGARESNAWITYPRDRDSCEKLQVIPDNVSGPKV